MRTSLAAIVSLVLILPAAAETQSWNIDGAHSSAQLVDAFVDKDREANRTGCERRRERHRL